MYILAVDPGLMTGIALFLIEEGTVTLVWSQEVGEIPIDFLIEEVIEEYKDNLEVVFERFVIGPKTPNSPWSLEKIGVIKFLCRKHSVKYTIQTPGQAKNFVTNKRLKNIKIWHKGGKGHALDALRHGVLYLVQNFKWRPVGLIDDEDDEE